MKSGLTEQQKRELLSIIRASFPKTKIFLFGSRIRGDFKQYSDLDVCIDNGAAVPIGLLGQLEEALSNTDLPFKVDLSDWHRITEEFQELILKTGVVA